MSDWKRNTEFICTKCGQTQIRHLSQMDKIHITCCGSAYNLELVNARHERTHSHNQNTDR
jgi:hypothetical protein